MPIAAKPERRKPGRPKLAQTLSQTYGTRLKPEEEKLVLRAIRRSGLTKADWIRTALVQAAREK